MMNSRTFRLWGYTRLLVVGLLLSIGYALPANASLMLEGTDNTNLNAAGELAAAQGFAEDVWGPLDPLFLLCKDDTPNEGGFCGVFTLDSEFVEGTSTDYELSWDLSGEDLSFYVAVTKAANSTNFYVVQDLAQLTSGGPVTLDSPTGQGISHVSLYGLEGAAPPQEAPEPGTVMLLGIALTALGAGTWRRRRID